MTGQYKTGKIMLALFISGFVGLFSETALNIALVDLSEIFNVSETTIQWLATGYFLTLGILVPVTGILMQKFTTRQMFITSLSLSIFGTILAAVAPSFSVLLIARIIQAAGLAIILPLTQSVIFTIYPPNKRGGAMGAMGLVILAGPALGPTISGMLLDALSWHWIFWSALPFLVFAIIFGCVHIPNVNKVRDVSIDALSVILSTIGFSGVVYGVSTGGERGWSNEIVIATIVIGLVALILFVLRQNKMEQPMLNLKAFKHWLFTLGLTMNIIIFFNMLSMLIILPIFMQVALGTSAFEAGLALLPGSLLNCLLAPIIGRMFDKYGPKVIIIPGTLLVVLGFYLYTSYGTETALWMIVVTHMIMMLGFGMSISPVQTNTLNAIPKKLYPDGIAISQTSQQVAGALGIAIMISLFKAQQSTGSYANIAEATTAGTTFAFTASLILAVINFVLALFLKPSTLK